MKLEIREELDKRLKGKVITENYSDYESNPNEYRSIALMHIEDLGVIEATYFDPNDHLTKTGTAHIYKTYVAWWRDCGSYVCIGNIKEQLMTPYRSYITELDVDPDGSVGKQLQERQEALNKMKDVSVGEY